MHSRSSSIIRAIPRTCPSIRWSRRVTGATSMVLDPATVMSADHPEGSAAAVTAAVLGEMTDGADERQPSGGGNEDAEEDPWQRLDSVGEYAIGELVERRVVELDSHVPVWATDVETGAERVSSVDEEVRRPQDTSLLSFPVVGLDGFDGVGDGELVTLGECVEHGSVTDVDSLFEQQFAEFEGDAFADVGRRGVGRRSQRQRRNR